MAQSDLTDIITTLFTAPAEASVAAEKQYRRIWMQWLQKTMALLDAAPEGSDKAKMLTQRLDLAPILKFEAAVDLGVTMRLVSVKAREGGGELGLAVGPFQAAGSFSFMSQSTSESILQARARYQLSNRNELTLRDYLQGAIGGVPSPESLKTDLDKLQALQA